LQVQPAWKEIYANKFLQRFAVKDAEQLSPENWEAFRRTVVVPNTALDRPPGQYAVAVRKHAASAMAPAPPAS
jgi:hypothetical protein